MITLEGQTRIQNIDNKTPKVEKNFVRSLNNFYQPIKTLKENVLKIVLNRVQDQRPNVDTVFEQINNKDGRITHIFMLLLSTFKKRNTQYICRLNYET